MIFTVRPVIVIGDVILDKYIHGTSNRLSPEAPVPIVKQTSIINNLGGAGNVAANIHGLGGNPVLIGITGVDNAAFRIHDLLSEVGMATYGLAYISNRKTTVKMRVVVGNHQIVRVDDENDHEEELIRELLTAPIKETMEQAAAIVISDYAKGVVSSKLLDAVGVIAQTYKLPVFIDPKVSHAAYYRREWITAMTPNLQEAEGLSTGADIAKLGSNILNNYEHKHVLITRGEHGMSLFTLRYGEITQDDIPTAAQHVFDVSGAGDAVIATLALAYASGYSMLDSAKLANRAAGVVVGKPGTVPITLEELNETVKV